MKKVTKTIKLDRLLEMKIDKMIEKKLGSKIDVAKPESKVSMKAHIQHWGLQKVVVSDIKDLGQKGKVFRYEVKFTYDPQSVTMIRGSQGNIKEQVDGWDNLRKTIQKDNGRNLKYIGAGNYIESVKISKKGSGTLIFCETLENKFATDRNRANAKPSKGFNSQLAALGANR